MFCHRCGANVPDDSKFCPKCGTNLQVNMGQSSIMGESVSPHMNNGEYVFGNSVPNIVKTIKGHGTKFWVILAAIVLVFIVAIKYDGISRNANVTVPAKNFEIEGRWQSVGEHGIGMAQPGTIVVFDGTNCNVLSPQDTYAFTKDGDTYTLYVSAILGGNVSFNVEIIDDDNIVLDPGSGLPTKLKRI